MRAAQRNVDELLRFFFSMRDTLKLYHWRTRCHARHVATNDLLQALDPLVDQFVEVYAGRYSRPAFGKPGFVVRVFEVDDAEAAQRLQRYAEYLRTGLVRHVDPRTDADLLTIRDEMLAAVNRASYLFTLS